MSITDILIVLCIILVITACIWKAIELSQLPVEQPGDAIYGPHSYSD